MSMGFINQLITGGVFLCIAGSSPKKAASICLAICIFGLRPSSKIWEKQQLIDL